jgi:hypothetical protein
MDSHPQPDWVWAEPQIRQRLERRSQEEKHVCASNCADSSVVFNTALVA